jgi:hypothetical protein
VPEAASVLKRRQRTVLEVPAFEKFRSGHGELAAQTVVYLDMRDSIAQLVSERLFGDCHAFT